MADKPTETHDGAAPVAASEPAPAPEPTKTGEPELSAKDEPKPEPQGEGDQADEEAKKPDDAQKSADDAPEKSQPEQDKPAADADVEMKDAAEDAAPEAEAEAPATEAAAETPAPKPKGGKRRKSTAGESKGKALNKKGSKARLTHTDAKPGDHFLVKLKGFPAWPAVICDETMLPAALLNSRPVSAARPDGTYSEAYADGGKRVHDRSFPVMYLYTNEFGWVQNTALSELTPEKAKDSITDKMRKDLRSAMELAAEDHPIDYYKNILTKFQEEQIAQEEARKEAAATPKKSKKGKGKGKAASEDEDAEMEDVDAAPKSAKSKKRKAEDDTATPQRTDSVKKPKIKLNTTSTPKAANGAATPKSAGASASKAAKPKAKKAKEGADKKEAPKEAKMTPEERHARKEKEVLYLRHKLQRGLLTREQQPREDEMKAMSDFITMLENFVDLEVSIIRATKINKVLKAILKLDSIPKEEDFQFKKRSQTLLDKWNKLLAGDGSAPAPAPTNGVNGGAQEKKSEANGVREESAEAKKAEPEQEKTSEPKQSEEKAVSDAGADKPAAETTEEKGDKEGKPAAETAPASEPVAAEN